MNVENMMTADCCTASPLVTVETAYGAELRFCGHHFNVSADQLFDEGFTVTQDSRPGASEAPVVTIEEVERRPFDSDAEWLAYLTVHGVGREDGRTKSERWMDGES